MTVQHAHAFFFVSTQCPSIRDGVCHHPFCKFAEDAHPPGTKFKNVFIHAN